MVTKLVINLLHCSSTLLWGMLGGVNLNFKSVHLHCSKGQVSSNAQHTNMVTRCDNFVGYECQTCVPSCLRHLVERVVVVPWQATITLPLPLPLPSHSHRGPDIVSCLVKVGQIGPLSRMSDNQTALLREGLLAQI